MPWGYHLILDCMLCNEHIKDEESIRSFLIDLVATLDMTAHGDPLITHFGHDNKKGYSAVQLITTSNISCHFCDDSNDAYIDIFSCKPYTTQSAIDCVMRHFTPINIIDRFIERTASQGTD